MRAISHCINKQLTDLCQRSMQLEELANKIGQFLPAELAKECQVGNFSKGCLTLTTSNAAWASQLRFAIPELRDKLRKEAGLYQLSSIKINVKDPIISKPAKAETVIKHQLSAQAQATIISESQNCSYEPLQKALFNLALTLKEPS